MLLASVQTSSPLSWLAAHGRQACLCGCLKAGTAEAATACISVARHKLGAPMQPSPCQSPELVCSKVANRQVQQAAAGKASKAGVWRLEADLQPVADLPGQDVPFRQVLWATAAQDQLASVEASRLRTWRLQGGAAQVRLRTRQSLPGVLDICCPGR